MFILNLNGKLSDGKFVSLIKNEMIPQYNLFKIS